MIPTVFGCVALVIGIRREVYSKHYRLRLWDTPTVDFAVWVFYVPTIECNRTVIYPCAAIELRSICITLRVGSGFCCSAVLSRRRL